MEDLKGTEKLIGYLDKTLELEEKIKNGGKLTDEDKQLLGDIHKEVVGEKEITELLKIIVTSGGVKVGFPSNYMSVVNKIDIEEEVRKIADASESILDKLVDGIKLEMAEVKNNIGKE